ncbi:MAG TPA: hypothetical protein VJZ78_07050 [Anaerolineales bacterium]|nr:hypothetical protein [Anaerolineales bacterium]
MKRSTFYGIAAVVAFLFALTFMLFPSQTMSFYGGELNEDGVFMARYFGSALFGMSVILWYARNSEDSRAQWAINFGGLSLSLTGLVTSLLEVFSGVGNVWVWSVVVVYLLLSVGFGYYHFKK